MKKEKELINQAYNLATKFVQKVETGKARSEETYAECKALIESIDKCNMKREKEKICLTDKELENFDFTGGSEWELREEKYHFIEEIRTDQWAGGAAWDIVVQRESDAKYFKWNCWGEGIQREFIMENGDNYMEEVFPIMVSIMEFE